MIFAAGPRASCRQRVQLDRVDRRGPLEEPAGVRGYRSVRLEGPAGRVRAYRQGLAGQVHHSFPLKGRVRALRVDPTQPQFNRVSNSARADRRSRVWGAAAAQG